MGWSTNAIIAFLVTQIAAMAYWISPCIISAIYTFIGECVWLFTRTVGIWRVIAAPQLCVDWESGTLDVASKKAIKIKVPGKNVITELVVK
jgi:hypothetical protein